VQDGFVTGIALDPNSQEEHCEACLYSWATSQPVPKVRISPQAEAFGEEIHTDVWGPSPGGLIFPRGLIAWLCLGHNSQPLVGGEGERGFSNDFNVCIRARVRVGGEDTPRARIWGEGVGGQRQNARISSKGEIWRRRKPLQTRICGKGEGGSEKCTHSLAFEGWRQVWVP
jgi:hypothetical protein